VTVSIDGGAPRTLDTEYYVQALALDATSLYLAPLNGDVMKMPLAGGPSTPLAPAIWAISLTTGAGNVYWIDRTGPPDFDVVKAVSRCGGGVASQANGAAIGPLAVNDTGIYWVENPTLDTFDLRKTPFGPSFSEATPPGTIVFGEGVVRRLGSCINGRCE
jgi:hypothetical protein